MEESTTLCSNCQRPIAASNFVTHSLHCQRNLTKCEKCGEAVPRSGLDEHESEFHAKVSCPDCHVVVEKSLLETHKKTACRSRQQGCPYCELELPACEINEHKIYCGSRTKKCEDCGEYVMLKYEQLHIESNHGFLKLDDEPGPTATWIKNDLESGSSRPAKSNNNKKPQINTGKFDDDEDDADDMPNLFANLMKKKKAVGTYQNYPGVAYPISGGPQRTVTRSPPPYQDLSYDSSDLVALPCEFCEAMIPVNQLILHQTACRMDVTSFGRAKNSKIETGKLKPNFAAYANDKDNDVDGGEQNSENKYYDDVLDWRRHENSELFDIRRNAIDEGTVDIRRNDISESTFGLRKNSNDGDPDPSLRPDLDDVGVLLPCEFCGDGYPPSLLLEHQDACECHPKNFTEAAPGWSETQDAATTAAAAATAAATSKWPEEAMRASKLERTNFNIHKELDQLFSNGTRGKSNIDSYNDLRGNFTVASEWSDDSDSRPTSATGAIPKQKAGKLNFSRKVAQEVPSSRSSNSVMSSHSRNNHSQRRIHIRNNLKDLKDDDDDDDN